AVSCWLSHPTASPNVAAVLDSLVPGLRIGARALPVAKRMHLIYEPDAGYADTSYQNQAGVRGLVLQITPEPESERQSPSGWARISAVEMSFVNRRSADAARQLLTRHLGDPIRVCTTGYDGVRHYASFWPDEGLRWVGLTVSRDSAQAAMLMFETLGPE